MRILLLLPEQPPDEYHRRLQNAADRQLHANERIDLARNRDLPLLKFALLPDDGPCRPADPECGKRSLLWMERKQPPGTLRQLEPEQTHISEKSDIALPMAAAASNHPIPFARLYAPRILSGLHGVHATHIPFSFG